LSFEIFRYKLSQTIPQYHSEMKTYYEDGDKDRILFSTETEFTCMLEHLISIKQDPIKIWVVDSNVPYFKDGTVQFQGGYNRLPDDSNVDVDVDPTFLERVTLAVSRLFPDNKILPFHIPQYLQNVISVKSNGVADAEVDINTDGAFTAINQKALDLLESKDENDLKQSKLLLESLQLLEPNNPYVYYNLACVESLLNNAMASFDQLQVAFNKGYSDVQHMLQDQDLSFLQEAQEQYSSIADWFSTIQQKTNTGPIKFEEVVKIEEPVKTEVVKIEEPVKTEVVSLEASSEPIRWTEEVNLLKNMGFQLDSSVFVNILDHHRGNVVAAIQDLI